MVEELGPQTPILTVITGLSMTSPVTAAVLLTLKVITLSTIPRSMFTVVHGWVHAESKYTRVVLELDEPSYVKDTMEFVFTVQ